jgi:transposase-like protein
MSSKKTKVEKVRCPQCGSYEGVGFLGGSTLKKFYCADCCIEFTVKGKQVKSYDITVGGTVVAK